MPEALRLSRFFMSPRYIRRANITREQGHFDDQHHRPAQEPEGAAFRSQLPRYEAMSPGQQKCEYICQIQVK